MAVIEDGVEESKIEICKPKVHMYIEFQAIISIAKYSSGQFVKNRHFSPTLILDLIDSRKVTMVS